MSNLFKKILIPTDFSSNSFEAFSYANKLASVFSSEIFLIHVLEPVIYPSDFGLSQIPIPPLIIENKKNASDELNRIINEYFSPELDVKFVIKTGIPYTEIINCISELSIDIMIISTHGHSSIEQIFFGNTSEKIIKRVSIPILLIRNKTVALKYE